MPKKAGAGAGKRPAAARKRAPAKRKEKQEEQEKPSGQAKLSVKQVRSGIGHAETYRRTLAALGLRHHQAVVVVPDNPSVRGMLTKVRHLVAVKTVEA